MTKRYPDLFDAVTSDRVPNDRQNSPNDPAIYRVMRRLHALWKGKVASNLNIVTGAPYSTCQNWVGNKRKLSAEALCKIIQSEDGGEALEALMGDEQPRWYRELNDGRNIVIAKKEKKLADKRFQEALERGADL